MYSIIGVLFCLLEGFLVAKFGWTALLWSPIGFFVGLFASANIVLPILMGIPMAISHTSKNEMRPRVFFALFRAPFIWITAFLLSAWLFPSASDWVLNNETLTIGLLFGGLAILLSPFSKKSRDDFRSDFDKSYGSYYTDQPNYSLGFSGVGNKKEMEATIRISSNLYLHDFSNSFDILNFQFPDSRFRCIIFCLTTVIKACNDLVSSPELLQKACLHFLSTFTTSKESVIEFFGQVTNTEQAEKIGSVYLKEYLTKWELYYEYVGSGDTEKATDVLCTMIHSFETDRPTDNSDRQRLNQLSWQLEFSLTNNTMRSAFANLIEN